MIRVLRVKATGQWCGPAVIDERLPDDPTYADRVAETLGLQPGSLEVMDTETDPRTGALIEDPNKPEPPDEPQPSSGSLLADALVIIGEDPALSKSSQEAIATVAAILRR